MSATTGAGHVWWVRLAGLALVLTAGVLAARGLGAGDLVHPDSLARLKLWIGERGALAPVVFVAGYALAELFFVPALPLGILGGIAFGPVRGTVYVSVGATIGAALAFLAARYAMRDAVARWAARSPRLARIDAAVAEHGWRVLMITRLVPLFPFNLQNFVYGLTGIGFWPFVGISWLCILPGTAAFVVAGSTLAEGRGSLRRSLGYLAVGGVLIVALSLLPRWLARGSPVAGRVMAEHGPDGPTV